MSFCCNTLYFHFSEWRFPSSSYVCTISTLLWILCFIWCYSNLPEMDYLLIIHKIWFWRNSSCYLWFQQNKTWMSSTLLSLQRSFNNSWRTGYAIFKIFSWHNSSCCYIPRFEDSCFLVFEMEATIKSLTLWLRII